MTNIKSLITLLSLLFIMSCNQDDNSNSDNPNPTDDFSENFGPSVSRDFIGQVVDKDSNPVLNATVQIGASTVQTDINGVFIINQADVHERFAYITTTKAGYINGSRSIVPTSGKNNIKIMLLPLEILETISSGTSSEVELPSGTKVVFDGAFQDESGNAYSGNVNVSMFNLMTSDQNISSLMPGMLYAQDGTGEQKVLETFGMMNVELRGSGGQKLQIASGHTAQITMLIDNSQMASAPATIPLWHFDEANGYWKEEGSATKQGNKYIGNVSHFSWWNCDAPFEVTVLNLTIVDSSGNPLSGMLVGLKAAGFPQRIGMTDNNGHVTGLIPANQILELKISSYTVCGGTSIYSSDIGPFTTETTLPNIEITTSGLISSTIVEGNLVKCDNSVVTNGYVALQYGNQTYISAITNGSFSISALACAIQPQFTLQGVDYDALQNTGTLSYNFAFPITTVGQVVACTSGSVEEHFTYQVDGGPEVIHYNIVGTYSSSSGLSINGEELIDGFLTTIEGDITGVGTYTSSQMSMWSPFSNIQLPGPAADTVVFTVTAFGAVGQYFEITFSGQFTNNSGLHTLTGSVHAQRDQ